MTSQNLDWYLKEAEAYAGTASVQPDGSNFSLTPPSQLSLKYDRLRQHLAQIGSPTTIAINWSIASSKISRNGSSSKFVGVPSAQPLTLIDLDRLYREGYLMKKLSPEDLYQFPVHTLGGAYFQYMCRGKFYEFDKNPTIPRSEIEWLFRSIRQTHDFYHLITEIYHYGWDGGFVMYEKPECYERDRLILTEELCLYGFMMGQVRLQAAVPIVAEWIETGLEEARKWLKEAFPLWQKTKNYNSVKKFVFPNFIATCEKFTYASFKLGRLTSKVTVEDYLSDLEGRLTPLSPSATVTEREYRQKMLESFERGLRSYSLLGMKWERYLGNSLQEIREFLNIPRRQHFQSGSHYLDADCY
ncbi:Coq4 family protein [Oxynema aestuarii]|jgi:hypothetical protein|uniref:Ubiquinone biosynthesis protein n=1 Tax=Oxynema aestuarii AP17 TaxID=2064643 RepID=A0A6H1TWE9_9CYAN|nr:Coq4 family protein [Oxynema aestuarii]QIZ70922.1 hypothetical protein HCG48_10255 [Oxynema aestuarii AP17]